MYPKCSFGLFSLSTRKGEVWDKLVDELQPFSLHRGGSEAMHEHTTRSLVVVHRYGALLLVSETNERGKARPRTASRLAFGRKKGTQDEAVAAAAAA